MEKRSLRFQIMLLLGGSLLLLTIISLGSFYNMELKAEHNILELNNNIVLVKETSEIKYLFGREIQEWKNIIIRGADPKANAKHTEAFDKTAKEIISKSESLKSKMGKDELELLSLFIQHQTELSHKYILAREEYLTVDNFSPAKADKAVSGLDRKVLDSLLLLDEKITKISDIKTQSALVSMKDILRLTLVAIVVITIISLVFGQFLISRITKTIALIVESLSTSANEVKGASLRIADTSEELSQAVAEQSSSIQETSSSIEEINSMITVNTDNAQQSALESTQSLNTTERGKKVVAQMIEAIGNINSSNSRVMDQIDETNKEIENIVKIINEIGTKTKVINDIVFQTKLLSFNASVEAARAGEQGKGFSVVAEEVGNLAAMSGAAALEITNMLEASIKTVERIARDSKEKIGKIVIEGKDTVATGTRVALECEIILNEIVNSVSSVSKMVSSISTASQEQALGVQEITKAISQLDQVTQQNAAASVESANAAASLSSQAINLSTLVQTLHVTIEGGH